MSGIPVFPIAIIAIVIASVGYALLRSDGDGEPQVAATLPPLPSGTIDVIIGQPQDGETVSNPITVAMVVSGAFLIPAGETADPEDGHLHLFIDQPPPSPGTTIVAGEGVIDISDGSNEATLPELAPGEHTITAVFSDTDHVTSNLAQPATITIVVQ